MGLTRRTGKQDACQWIGLTRRSNQKEGGPPWFFVLKMQWPPFVQRIPADARADPVRGGDRLSCQGQKLLGTIPEGDSFPAAATTDWGSPFRLLSH